MKKLLLSLCFLSSTAFADTLTVYPDAGAGVTAADTSLGYIDVSWATAHNAASAETVSNTATAENCISQFAGGAYNIRRLGFSFDASSLNDDVTIDSATLSLYGGGKVGSSYSQYIVSWAPADPGTPAVGDYNDFGTTAYSTKTAANFSTVAYNDYSLSAGGISDISLTAVSSFGLRLSGDALNQTPSSSESVNVKMADNSGTSADPKLVINYTEAATDSSIFFGTNF